MKDNKQGLNILVCGSQSFDFDLFVENIMDSFYSVHQERGVSFKQVYTSQVSGACKYAREWLKKKNEQLMQENSYNSDYLIKHKDYTFTLLNSENGHSLYDDLVIPKFVLENDEMFIKGKEEIQKLNVHQVFAFPNLDGIIGAHSRNIVRFAQLAGIQVVDCSDLLRDYLAKFNHKYPTEEDKLMAEMSQQKPQETTSVLALKNLHRAKTFR